ncbi:YXWGXW repeat-containing protein [Variovorax sp.]|uniref:YXWGXW repeat-containing protein n=1 Tax=Variovorax sp. TaxID=1871043 RepID=UPI002D43C498|nr:YXWGXW repeat-containing protein [Variovorax sp.]HYP81848.1 YXWGXW repeat-containing protein [Variovorax sp.]
MKKLLITAGAAALMSLGTLALPSTALADVAVSVQFGPPPPPVREVVPAPRPGHVWAPGHYEYRKGHYVWSKGRWMDARPGYAYHAPQWQERNGRWYYNQARWDRDGDGIANRDDRHPDRPDAARHDRDHDGVANAYDRRPDDPHRR